MHMPVALDPWLRQMQTSALLRFTRQPRGKPRAVNNICHATLIATVGADKNLVDHATAKAAIAEITTTG